MAAKDKILITTVPFGARDESPVRWLKDSGYEYEINPLNKKLTEDELCELAQGYTVLIAGTEPITQKVMEANPQLRMISRVGIGLDSVDLHFARERNIQVSYTPDAPAPAVSELTMGLMLSCLRQIHVSDRNMHEGNWYRYFGRRIEEVTIGIVGVGRIGGRVLEHLKGFRPKQVLVNDKKKLNHLPSGVKQVEKDEIYRNADVISLHVPLTKETRDLITAKEIRAMKKDAIIVNTARGGIVNEADLLACMQEGLLSSVALDVFDFEPYQGPLSKLNNLVLTSHMGSMSVDCRGTMECEATAEVLRFLKGEPLLSQVPEHEYEVRG